MLSCTVMGNITTADTTELLQRTSSSGETGPGVMLNAAEPGNTATGSDAVRPASAASGKAAPKTPATGSNAEYQVDEDGHILDGMVFDDVTEKSFVPTVSYVDEFGEPLTGHYTDFELPGFGETLVLDDPENAPVDDVVVRSGFLNMHRTTFSYLYATADGARIREIRKTTSTEEVELEIPDDSTRSNASRATADNAERILEVEKEVYAYTADGEEWTDITEDTELLFVFAQEGLTSYVYEDDDVTVTAQLQYEDAIPAGVELKVTPITEETNGYNYDAYMQALNDNAADLAAAEDSAKNYSRDNTLLYDIAFIKTGSDGKEVEYEPEKGSIKITADFHKNQLSGTLGAASADKIDVIHLPLTEEVKETIDATKDAVDISAADIKTEKIEDAAVQLPEGSRAAGDSEKESVEFIAESFSAFAFTYTVDFTYGNYTYSFPGQGSYALTSVLAALNLTGDVKDASLKLVKGKDHEGALYLSRKDDGWYINSDRAFTDTYELTVKTEDKVYVITVTDAQDALTVNVKLYDYDDETKVAFPSDFGGSDNIFLVAWVGTESDISKADHNTPWASIEINGIKGQAGMYTTNVQSFYNQPSGGNPVDYSSLTDEQKGKMQVRIVHTKENQLTLEKLKQWAQGSDQQREEYEELWNGGFDGFDISKNHSSGITSPDQYDVNFKKGNRKALEVALQFNPSTEKGAIPGGRFYVLLDALSKNGNDHYYYVVEAKTDGSQDKVYLPITGNWSRGQKFSNNWQSIEASVIVPMPGKTINPGGTELGEADYSDAFVVGDYQYTYKGRTTDIDTQQHIQHDEFLFELSKKQYKAAITPEEILGDAYEFGIVADTYEQKGHSETNYAVKNLNHNANTDVCGSGTGAMPFYVSNVTANTLDIHLTSCPIDLFIPSDQDSMLQVPHIKDLKESVFGDDAPEGIRGLPKLVEYNLSHNEIESYVDRMIADGGKKSVDLKNAETTMRPVLSGNRKTIDTRQFPDGKTIYVDCTDCTGVIETSGWIINKLPNQSIVFNIPGENVKVGEFHVNVYDESGNKLDETGSTTDARDDGTSEKNRKVDTIIFDHISFNAYQAKTLDLNNASALFLAPKAERVTQSNGAGWILAKGTVDSGSEWHFYRRARHYKTKGDFSLSGKKKIIDGTTEKDYSEFSSMTFTFEAYKCDENGNIPLDAKALESTTAGSDGSFKLSSAFKYTQAEVPEGQTKTFYYVIKEQVPEGGRVGNVKYDAAPVYVKVVATDDSQGKITFKIFTAEKPEEGSTFDWKEVERKGTETPPVYDIGGFANTYEGEGDIATIKATKSFNDWGKADSFTFKLAAVTAGAPMPATDTATATKDATLASFGEIEYEKAGTYEYTITEVNGGVDGVTYDTTAHKVKVTVTKKNDATNALTAEVTYDGEKSLTVTNTFKAAEAELEVTKKFNDWDKAEKFEFRLDAVTEGAPVPEVMLASATNAERTAKFGKITYDKAGTYEYTITEVNGGVDGVTYDTTAHKVVVTVTKAEDATNALSAEVTYDGEKSLTITNTFKATEAELEVTKDFKDWGKAEKFEFQLEAVTADAPVPEVMLASATNAEPVARFEKITYEKAGTYEYTITEVNGGADGVTYDTTAHKVVVTVTKAEDETNALAATVKYDDADSLTITNTFTSVRKELEVTKEFKNWGKADSFTFELKPVDGAPMPAEKEKAEGTTKETEETADVPAVKATATNAEKTAKFGEIEYVKAGTYKYTITEVNDGIDGVSYDTTEHNVTVTVTKADDATNKLTATVKYDDNDSLTITNTFTSVKKNLEVTKKYDHWGEEDVFEFKLAAVTDGAPMPENLTATASDAQKTAVFGEIEFEKAGTYEYTITEQDGGAKGVTYDTEPHKVTVTVTKADDATNELTASVDYEGSKSLTVTNTYDAEGTITFEAEKKMEGGSLNRGDFTFTVREGDPDTGVIVATGSNAAADTGKTAKVTFTNKDDFAYTLDDVGKTYTYYISEDIPDGAVKNSDGTWEKDDVIYDTTVVKVTVTDIADKGDGTITAKVNYPDGGRTFTNRRTEKTQVHVRKVWRNATARTQPASVTIRLVADGKDTDRSLKLSEDNGWSGSFDGLQVKTDGKAITYTVTEDTVSGYSTSIEKDGDDYSFVVTNTRHSGGGGGGGGGGRRTPGTTAHQTTAPETQPGETVGSTESGVLPKTGMAERIWALLTGGIIGLIMLLGYALFLKRRAK